MCIIIPARNEEKTISKTLNSIISQTYKNLMIIIIDDQSDDRTYEISLNTLKKCKFTNFKIIKGNEPPSDWSGKLWALNQGVIEAKKNKLIEYLLFLDADITINKTLVHDLVLTLKQKNLKMISLMAKLNCRTFWEKILIPQFIYFFQKLYPFFQVNNNESKVAAAAGGCIFMDIKLFQNKNLLEKIKSKIIDDCNLAKLIKQKGKIWLGLTKKVTSIRSYKELNLIWKMVSRCAYEQLNNSLFFLFLSSLGIIILYLAWPISLVIGFFLKSKILIFLSLLILILSTIIFIPTLLFYKQSKFYLLMIPFSALLYLSMTISSALNYYFNNGNLWKGRKLKKKFIL